MSLALEEPIACQWDAMSAFLNMPLDGSDYMYIDEEVPFLPLVLRGVLPLYGDYVNFEANKTEFFLRDRKSVVGGRKLDCSFVHLV